MIKAEVGRDGLFESGGRAADGLRRFVEQVLVNRTAARMDAGSVGFRSGDAAGRRSGTGGHRRRVALGVHGAPHIVVVGSRILLSELGVVGLPFAPVLDHLGAVVVCRIRRRLAVGTIVAAHGGVVHGVAVVVVLVISATGIGCPISIVPWVPSTPVIALRLRSISSVSSGAAGAVRSVRHVFC